MAAFVFSRLGQSVTRKERGHATGNRRRSLHVQQVRCAVDPAIHCAYVPDPRMPVAWQL